jgi:hypothetical protein
MTIRYSKYITISIIPIHIKEDMIPPQNKPPKPLNTGSY